jgi:4-methyl-5(b-hydroxyethyl)-thiazole monophosphate biosynthesis
VVDGNTITSQGPATTMAFSLKLVELLYGRQKADEIAQGLLYTRFHNY